MIWKTSTKKLNKDGEGKVPLFLFSVSSDFLPVSVSSDTALRLNLV